MSSTQIFLRFTISPGNEIAGEASAAGYEGQIEVESFGWGVSASHPLKRDSTSVRPQINYDQLSISKFYDSSSTALANHFASRTGTNRVRFSRVEITVDHHRRYVDSKKSAHPMMLIELRDGYVEEIRLAVSEGGKAATLKEDLKLSFDKVNIFYYPASADRTKRQLGAVGFRSDAY